MNLLKVTEPLAGMGLEGAAARAGSAICSTLSHFVVLILSHQIRPVLIELMKEKIRWEGELWPSEQRN